MSIPVPCYGIHWHGGVAFLHQDGPAQNAVGLKKTSPFSVTSRLDCNHVLDVLPVDVVPNHWKHFYREFIKSDDLNLVQVMLPIPRGGIFFAEERNATNVYYLASMSCPITTPVHPSWVGRDNFKRVFKELNNTNIQPYCVTGLKAKDSQFVRQLVELAQFAPRTIVLTGSEDVALPPEVVKIPRLENMARYDFGLFGRHTARLYMRGEL